MIIFMSHIMLVLHHPILYHFFSLIHFLYIYYYYLNFIIDNLNLYSLLVFIYILQNDHLNLGLINNMANENLV
jgi:hypothetical protein